jgi:CYTH domain-containing protein
MGRHGRYKAVRKTTRNGIPMHSQYRGVTKDLSGVRRKRWKAVITVKGKQRSIGRYEHEIDAALAYANELIKFPFSR